MMGPERTPPNTPRRSGRGAPHVSAIWSRRSIRGLCPCHGKAGSRAACPSVPDERRAAVTGNETAARAYRMDLTIAECISAVRRAGEDLAIAAARTPLDAPLPACPAWRLRDLLRHLGGVHRWATTYVATGRMQAMDAREEEALMASWPADNSALLEWFRAGHTALVQA